ncbi:MAG: hypothetical protein IV100_00215 [Myxococcales bacterium]|nr:hypothetical protein [Myxococcales bacterium]
MTTSARDPKTGPCPYCWNETRLTEAACVVCAESLHVLDRFRLTGLAHAPDGAVQRWHAEDLMTGALVTVTATDGLGTHRPETEFEAAARLLEHLSAECPSLPRVLTATRERRTTALGARFVLVTERLAPATLWRRIEHDGARPTADDALVLLRGLASGLAVLHGRLPPVVHGDLAPSAVGFRSDTTWEPVLLGLETGAGLAAMAPPITPAAVAYASPERLAALPLTPEGDRVSLAAVLYFAVTGTPPTALRGPGQGVDRTRLIEGLPDWLRSHVDRLLDGDSVLGVGLPGPSGGTAERSTGRAAAPLVIARPDGSELAMSLPTPLTRRLLRSLGNETRFLDSEQQALFEPREDGWYLVPNTSAPNETLLNGETVWTGTRLKAGDVVAVGRAAKGVAKLPLRVVSAV